MFSEHQQHNASNMHYTAQCEAPLHKTDFMVKTHQIQCLMFVDPCIIVQFIKKNPTRCNNVSKFLLFHIYVKLDVFRATRRPSSGA